MPSVKARKVIVNNRGYESDNNESRGGTATTKASGDHFGVKAEVAETPKRVRQSQRSFSNLPKGAKVKKEETLGASQSESALLDIKPKYGPTKIKVVQQWQKSPELIAHPV